MEAKAIISKLLVAILLLVAVNLNAQVLGTERINYENTTLNGGGVWTIDSIAAYAGRNSSVTVATANGFSSSKSGNVITLIAPNSGIQKSNGTALSAATAGTDYSAGTAALATGILKSTTTTGGLSIAVAGDFPTLNQNTTGTSANITGIAAIANGGSGQSTQAAAITALTGTQTANYVLASNGTNAALQALTVAMLPTSIPNANLQNTSVTINGTAVALGASSNHITLANVTAQGATTSTASTYSGGLTSSGATTLSNQIITPPATTSTGATLTIGTGVNNQPINSTSTTTVTITAGATAGRQLKIQVAKTSTGSVVLQSSGAETFNGGSSWTLAANSQGSKITLELIGTDYQVTFQ